MDFGTFDKNKLFVENNFDYDLTTPLWYANTTTKRAISLDKRKKSIIPSATTHSAFLNVLSESKHTKSYDISKESKSEELKPKKSKKRKPRPLLCEKFSPKRDTDLVMYEQYAQHVRSFFSEWFKHLDEHVGTPPPILFISGPCGSGKSQSVDILSKKYGFRLIDLDFASGASFEDVKNATTSARENTGDAPEEIKMTCKEKGVLNPYYVNSQQQVLWDTRPGCVHIDCLDGMTSYEQQKFVRDLLKLCTANPLKRPIVLFTNNRFTPAFFDLRKSKYVREAAFRRPTLQDMRTQILCLGDKHFVNFSRDQVDRAVEMGDCDIRASLLALQYSNSSGLFHSVNARDVLNSHRSPQLEHLVDWELSKLHDRVFDISLDTNVCWDMCKLNDISEWNWLTDLTSRCTDADEYRRATLDKYRQLFQSGTSLAPRAPTNIWEAKQQTRDIVDKSYLNSHVEVQRNWSKQSVMLDLVPVVGLSTGLADGPIKPTAERQRRAEQITGILQELGVKEVIRTRNGPHLSPDIYKLGMKDGLKVSPEIEREFPTRNSADKPIKRVTMSKQSSKPTTVRPNFFKPEISQSQQERQKGKAGVWLDFKKSDENSAKRSIGLKDFLVT